MIILSILFFVTALIYSSVGFGGGSTYLAILLIWGVPYTIFPVIALVCNIIVVSGNSINFIRSKNINFNLLFPYLIGSIPFAFIGGSIKIEKSLFEILLFCVLLVAGIFLLIESKSFNKDQIKINKIPRLISISIGSIIGFMSGLVGIGGGIFLSPLLFLMKAGYPRHITSSASLFILINSIFGIAGQLTKDQVLDQVTNYWPLFLAVLIGGQIGSLLNIKFLSNKILALLTSFLVIFVAIRMGIKLIA
ncbi:sulfite exporter TauE/SafE family protein [Candidatus Pelagibacter communis]|uniref:sulfite exporter TauE/SafE family protein n=1 Tax=Pelagibacter ubique TaxID=198252 RepID=UPI00094D2B44|nr:sulfite exporter TauE/SafE family protein [Candidatus Pelagibacter ubique]